VSFAAITLCSFSTSVSCCLFRYRLSPETFGYSFVYHTTVTYNKTITHKPRTVLLKTL